MGFCFGYLNMIPRGFLTPQADVRSVTFNAIQRVAIVRILDSAEELGGSTIVHHSGKASFS